MPQRHLVLCAYMSGSGAQGDSWRHPAADTDAWADFDHYARYARTLERGLFDALFFYDTMIAPPDLAALEGNPGLPRWDPVPLIAALSVVTRHIGLIATVSTTYNEPYNVARQFAAIDRISGGRAGWNVVTSTGGGENFNLPAHVDHAQRYERAHEFYDVVTGLWDTMADDAVIADKTHGIWLDPDKVRHLDHRGRFFSVKGPINAPRPIQGWPVIAQAGGSEAGRDLAARIGEFIYSADYTIPAAVRFRQDIHARMAAIGRDPGGIRICPGVSPFVGRSDTEAQDLYQEWQEARDLGATLRALSHYGSLGIDLSQAPLDGPVPLPDVLPETNSHKSRQSVLAQWIRETRPTVRQVAERLTAGGHRIVVGSPRTIADDFEAWFTGGAADGFNIMFPSAPDGIDRFVDLVVPELQRRGLFRQAYACRTLRENLGLPRIANRHFTAHARAAQLEPIDGLDSRPPDRG
jgi:FMN-dependent oxidoreductase (nitrilotriacetate monooxygenase family)